MKMLEEKFVETWTDFLAIIGCESHSDLSASCVPPSNETITE